MTNVNNLTQPNNQEVIVEEINEEELEGVVGGFSLLFPLLGPILAGADQGLGTTLGSLSILGD